MYKVKELNAFTDEQLVQEFDSVSAKMHKLRRFKQFVKSMRANLGNSRKVLLAELTRRTL